MTQPDQEAFYELFNKLNELVVNFRKLHDYDKTVYGGCMDVMDLTTLMMDVDQSFYELCH